MQHSLVRWLGWIGIAASLALLGFAVWIHLHSDPLIRILPVLLFGGGGVMLGLLSVEALLGARAASRPPPGMSEWAAIGFGLLLIAVGLEALLRGEVQMPPNLFFEQRVRADASPASYWSLVLLYLAGGAALVASRGGPFRRRLH